jgi:ABC-type bacteriocin/lantibiotic exporter with double-glycine peptidase domain
MASTNDSSSSIHVNSNSKLDITAIPTTQKQFRKLKKENEQLQRILELEALEREREAAEIAQARMMAIKASRALGRKSLTGVNIDKFSLPHPSGQGDLLSDASLVLSPGRRYGLVGKNGAGIVL